ncbi:MAG: PIN domain nuclease [Acidobacteria bacterium]|nr:MAG: PIN domain nuclease [Acidobacteriota bacterium]
MSYLLDTGVWLWSVGEPERMSSSAREIFADRTEELFLSAVTSWEVAIKVASGKLRLPEPPGTYVPSRIMMQGLRPLPISHMHALAVHGLPPHHRDPFDRLLIAQAIVENMTLLTADREFKKYDLPLLWCGR